jgi:SCY1-like protein 2
MKTIRELTNRVEEAHSKHLREVKSLEEQTRRITSEQAAIVSGTNTSSNGGGVDFESLVNGKSSNGNSLQQQAAAADLFGDMTSSMPTTPTFYQQSVPSPSPLNYSPQPMNQSIPAQTSLYSSNTNTSTYSSYQQPQSNSPSFTTLSPMQSPMNPMGTGGTTSSYGSHSSSFGTQSTNYGQQSTSSFGQPTSNYGQSTMTPNYSGQSSSSIMSSNQAAQPTINWNANVSIPTLQPPRSNNLAQGFSTPATKAPSTTPNYAAMQNLSLNSSPSTMPTHHQSMSSGLGMLQPMAPMNSSARSTTTKTPTTHKKSSDLDLFDPLG